MKTNGKEITLRILGCGSAATTLRHHPSAQVLEFPERSFLIDCGEGTGRQLIRYGIKTSRITDIFISHLHADHVMGLPGLVCSMVMNDRKEALRIHTTEQGRKWLNGVLALVCPEAPGLVEYRIFQGLDGEILLEEDDLQVSAVKLHHRIPSTGFVFRHPRGSYAYMSDTTFRPEAVPFIRGVDTLYHEATYPEAKKESAELYFHSTADDAGMIACDAGVNKLVLGHYSAGVKQEIELVKEAENVFAGEVIAANEGMVIPIHS